jgi:AcrR family transcriptional regulator
MTIVSTVPPIDGRRARGDLRRASALAKALEIAAVDGLEGISFGRLASAAGMPKSTLQALFKDREVLQLETLRHGADLFEAEVAGAIRAETGSFQRLVALLEAWFDVVQRKTLPGGCLVTASEPEFRARPGALREMIELHRARWRETLRSYVKAAATDGSLNQDVDADDLVFELMALQSAANVAASKDCSEDIVRARRSVRRVLASLGTV